MHPTSFTEQLRLTILEPESAEKYMMVMVMFAGTRLEGLNQ